jgi:hypothetical protein
MPFSKLRHRHNLPKTTPFHSPTQSGRMPAHQKDERREVRDESQSEGSTLNPQSSILNPPPCPTVFPS